MICKTVFSLQSIGFTLSSEDQSFFVKDKDSNFIALLVYIDDIIFIGNSSCEIQKVTLFIWIKLLKLKTDEI